MFLERYRSMASKCLVQCHRTDRVATRCWLQTQLLQLQLLMLTLLLLLLKAALSLAADNIDDTKHTVWVTMSQTNTDFDIV